MSPNFAEMKLYQLNQIPQSGVIGLQSKKWVPNGVPNGVPEEDQEEYWAGLRGGPEDYEREDYEQEVLSGASEMSGVSGEI